MINAEKYLKDSVAITEFVIAFRKWYYGEERIIRSADKDIENFLREKVQFTLTEDERVILKSIDGHIFEDIRRNKSGFLELYDECLNEWIGCQFKDSLFQFIKERRRIFNKRTVRR